MDCLRLMNAFENETDTYVWYTLLSQLERIENLLQEQDDPMNALVLARFSKLVQRFLNKTYMELGWTEKKNERI